MTDRTFKTAIWAMALFLVGMALIVFWPAQKGGAVAEGPSTIPVVSTNPVGFRPLLGTEMQGGSVTDSLHLQPAGIGTLPVSQ